MSRPGADTRIRDKPFPVLFRSPEATAHAGPADRSPLAVMISFLTLALTGSVCAATPAPRVGVVGSALSPSAAPFAAALHVPRADSVHQRLFDGGQPFADFVAAARNRKEQWERHYASAVVSDTLVQRLGAAGGPWRLLVVTRDGCSDSVNSVPYIAALVARVSNVELRLVTPNEGQSVMDAHRTPDGRAATPTVVLLDGAYVERGCWIERPVALREWMAAQRGKISDAEIFDGKMQWYEEEKGAKTLVEIVEMIEAAARGDVRCGGA